MSTSSHPFRWLPEHRLQFFTMVVVVASTSMTWYMSQSLGSDQSGAVIGWELAWTVKKAVGYLAVWKQKNMLAAVKFQVWIDYLYLVLYPAAISLVLIQLGRLLVETSAGLSRWLFRFSWLVLLSGLFDAIENVGLLVQLYDRPGALSVKVAFVFAALKFGVLFLSFLLLLLGAGRWLLTRLLP